MQWRIGAPHGQATPQSGTGGPHAQASVPCSGQQAGREVGMEGGREEGREALCDNYNIAIRGSR